MTVSRAEEVAYANAGTATDGTASTTSAEAPDVARRPPLVGRGTASTTAAAATRTATAGTEPSRLDHTSTRSPGANKAATAGSDSRMGIATPSPPDAVMWRLRASGETTDVVVTGVPAGTATAATRPTATAGSASAAGGTPSTGHGRRAMSSTCTTLPAARSCTVTTVDRLGGASGRTMPRVRYAAHAASSAASSRR